MKHKSHISRWDYVFGNMFNIATTPLYPTLWLLFSAVIALTALKASGPFVAVVVFAAWFTFCIVVHLALLGVSALMTPSLKKGVLGEHRYELTEEGLVEETDYNRNLHKWGSMDRIRRIGPYVLVRLYGNQGYMFPVSSFRSEQECEEFFNNLRERNET